jgi:putative addiction module component (TIGR02574 family)
MNQRLKTIFADAQKLSSEEREELAEMLLATIEPDETGAEIEKAWAEEAERRWDEVRKGNAELIDADEVFADIRRKLAEKSDR